LPQSSSSASTVDIARRYERSEVIASNASATRMIREPGGTSAPASQSGYPDASQCLMVVADQGVNRADVETFEKGRSLV
jgi:hypothetical protein